MDFRKNMELKYNSKNFVKMPSNSLKIYKNPIKGDEKIVIGPESKSTYTFEYTGQNYSLKTAGRIYFRSKVTGEFWYLIQSEPRNPLPEQFGPIESEFGGWAEFELPYRNCSNRTTEVTIHVCYL